jgi:hypothetical protein
MENARHAADKLDERGGFNIMRLLVIEVQHLLLETSRMNSSGEVKQRCG